MLEEYFSADRLVKLSIGSVVQIISAENGLQFTASLVGIDCGHSVITTLPRPETKSDPESYAALFREGSMFEMQTIHDGRIVGFEVMVSAIYGSRLLICSFPEMIETRRLRSEIRFPCVLSCDIRYQEGETYGAITDISSGGCQISLQEEGNITLIEAAKAACQPLELEVFLPISETPSVIAGEIKSIVAQTDESYLVGIAFSGEHDCIYRYLESLHLDSVAPFFS